MDSFDPNAMFNALVKEAQTAQPSLADTGEASNEANSSGLDPDFFRKIASNDPDALQALQEYVEARTAEGATPDDISAEISAAEAEAMGDDSVDYGDGSVDHGGQDSGDGEFEMAKAAAEAEAIEKAISDELESSPLAKVAGVDRAAVEQYLLGESAGEAYYHARRATAEIVEKIASQVIASDEDVGAAIEFLRDQGLDVSAIEAEIADMSKEASATAQESVAAAAARAMAEQDENMNAALAILGSVGFDTEKLAEEATEKKKKMSLGKKVGIGATVLGGTAAAAYGGKKLAPHIANMMKKAPPSQIT